MDGKIRYQFEALMWRVNAQGGWHFVSLPKDISDEIREALKWQEQGWGRMKATAIIGDLRWETAIWFDTKRGTYILPIKSIIRTKTGIRLNEATAIQIEI
jgi:hypothetical protein